ncbi:MAG: hypothetical protein NVSMB4_04400 [Acidimicrobiales bacterium]
MGILILATAAEITGLLSATSIPRLVVEELLGAPSPLWLSSAPADVLAKDLALCHPPLGANEVRAVAQPLDRGLVRLTVVAHDRHGLLADTAAVLAAEGVSVLAASALTWTSKALALHALTVSPGHMTKGRWDELGTRLRAVGAGERIALEFTPLGQPEVSCVSASDGRLLLSVTAEDQVGLLWAICRWLADERVGIESAHIEARGGRAHDRFLVHGRLDPDGLRTLLTAASRNPIGNLAAGIEKLTLLPYRLLRTRLRH